MKRLVNKFIGFGLGLVWGCGLGVTMAAEPAHQHGHGVLNVAVDGRDLMIELIAPGADIVGFEHLPETEQDKSAVRTAAGKLKNGLSLFTPAPGAMCELREVDIKSSLMEHGGGGQGDHGPKEHGHKDHGHKDHGHKDQGHKDEEDDHREFRVRYHVVCGAPGNLTHLDANYFGFFPKARELDARVIGERGQSAKELTRGSPRLTF